MNAYAELQIDYTPMEEFESEAFNEKLELYKKSLNTCVLLGIGWRDNEDASQESKKVRKSIDTTFGEII
jgi:hypothetical protein